MKAGCGKTARPVCAADGGQRKSNRARLLRPDSEEAALMVVERRGRVIDGESGQLGRRIESPAASVENAETVTIP
jgi:hypothetical protein